MQSDIARARNWRNWRRASFALFIGILAGTLTYAATGGPGPVFYVVGAVVLVLLGFDLLIRARVESADRVSAKTTSAVLAMTAANQASINGYSSHAGDGASVIGGSV
jgi:hypothetical protein